MAVIYGMADSEKSLLKELPKEVRDIDDINRVKKDFQNKLKKEGKGFFAGIRKWNYKRQINKFEDNKDSTFHAGAKGENKVIEELEKLNDSFHVMCGVKLQLSYYVRYKGKRNLKSAQMDIVVVCPKGVYMIEVKNWSDKYVPSNSGLNPYEQTERAGRVLWISLQTSVKDVRVTNVLLSIKGNLPYNKSYRSVFVSSLSQICGFLNRREDILSEKEVKKVVKDLKWFVTK